MTITIEDLLRDIKNDLGEIKAILTLTNQEKLEKTKEILLPKGSWKEKIYQLCDGSNTTKAIAQTIGKDDSYVRANLNVLRREGLVRTVEKEGQQIHEQIF